MLVSVWITMITGASAQSRDCGMPDLGSEFYARLHDSLRRTETPEVFSKKAEQKAYEALKERNKNFISGLFYSDLIVYDPIVSPYLESLMQRLIAGSQQLFTVRPNLFLSRSKIPNAYTTGSGIIIVNAAYIYPTKTEADLLCCIGHELGHFLPVTWNSPTAATSR
ncbi:MAG: M48 family metalloprotease [Chitinophagaceae bacterium]